jgi:uncharacterized protein (TIGR02001 family)
MLKKLTLAISAASTFAFSGLAVSETFGDFDVSMTSTLATDYIWRGQSQTDGSPAIQGSLDVAHSSGVYAGIWASNIDSNVAFPGNSGGADIEVDYYVGYGGSITDDISYDINVTKYAYDDASVWNSADIIPSISAYGATLGYKWNFDADSGKHSTYTWLSYEYELPYEIGISASWGVTDAKAGGDDYNDWSIGVSKTFVGLGWGLTYTDTDITDGDCEVTYGDSDNCDSNLTLSVSKSF